MKIFVVIPSGHKLNKSDKTVWITVPDSTIMRTGKKFYIPDFDSRFSPLAAVAFKVSRLGKGVSAKFAPRYYSECAPSFCIIGADTLDRCRADGLPWDCSMVFDYSFWIGDMIQCSSGHSGLPDLSVSVSVELKEPVELKATCLMHPDEAVEIVSRYNTIKMGDLIVIPTAMDHPVLEPQSVIKASINGNELFKTYTK